MNLQQCAYIFSQYTPLLDRPEDFNTRINWGSMQHFFACIKNKDFVALRPFKIIRGEGDNPPIHFVNGTATLPADFQACENIYYILDGNEVRLNIVEDNMFERLRASTLEKPTAKYPIANIQSNFIRVSPRVVRFATLTYIRKPKDIVFGVDYSLGYAQYSSVNSVQMEWDEENQIAIMLIVLSSLGINTTREEIERRKQ